MKKHRHLDTIVLGANTEGFHLEGCVIMLTTSRFSRSLIPVLLLLVLAFVGCSSEDSTTPPPATPDQTAEEIIEMIIEPQEENDQVLADLLTAGMDTMAAMDSVCSLI